MPDRKTFSDRLRAARIALGMDQVQLEKAFVEDGYAKRIVGQLEREELEIRGIHIAAVVSTTGFPEEWFISPDPRPLLAERDAASQSQLDRVAEALDQLAERVLDEGELTEFQQLKSSGLHSGEQHPGASNE